MKHFKVFIAVIFLNPLFISYSVRAATHSVNSNAHPILQDIQKEIATQGARETLERLYGNGEDNGLAYVMDQIDSGRAEWIALVPKLSPGTGGGAITEWLNESLEDALIANPSAVLAIVNTELPEGYPLTPDSICSLSFQEDKYSEIEYIRLAKAAVSSVEVPNLQKAKKACLLELEKIPPDRK